MDSRGAIFHGARKQIFDTHIRPPSVTGVPATFSEGYTSGSTPHEQMAFATPNENHAWHYAKSVTEDMRDPVYTSDHKSLRSRVYEVEHAKDERENNTYEEIESKTGFKMKKTPGKWSHTIQHHTEVGKTGTFPTHNWNAYKAAGSRQDANHPDHPEPDAEAAHELPPEMNAQKTLPGLEHLRSQQFRGGYGGNGENMGAGA